MLFNSYPFLFGFLPLALLGHQVAAHWHRRAVVVWLSLASLAFYAYWRPAYLLVLCASILFNYSMGCLISRRMPNRIPSGGLLAFAIAINLGALCYYKYLFPMLNFAADHLHGSRHWANVILPLGISFFTFTQIAYLVDLQQGGVKQQDLGSYTLFATFFPHLIAGPILHHSEIMPQFLASRDYRLRADDLAVGFSWFVMGLAKKVLLADNFATGADAAYRSVSSLNMLSAWAGALAYALQLYFDFSGYSDMALGLARMFSIDFPLNFSSPYKARSIIDFWQRWHMTLTRYINLYVYNPVAVAITRWRVMRGKKISRKAMATPSGFFGMIAMPTLVALFLAGVWHGAGVQFIIFGLLHAIYLTINHAWQIFRGKSVVTDRTGAVRASFGHRWIFPAGSVLLTFGAVLIGQVFFRAESVAQAGSMLTGMAGLHSSPAILGDPAAYHPTGSRLFSLALGYAIVWGFPNTQQILAHFKPALEITAADRKPRLIPIFWKPTAVWGLALGLVLFIAIVRMQDPSTFLYFQF